MRNYLYKQRKATLPTRAACTGFDCPVSGRERLRGTAPTRHLAPPAAHFDSPAGIISVPVEEYVATVNGQPI